MVQFTYRNILKENIVNYIASGNKRGKKQVRSGTAHFASVNWENHLLRSKIPSKSFDRRNGVGQAHPKNKLPFVFFFFLNSLKSDSVTYRVGAIRILHTDCQILVHYWVNTVVFGRITTMRTAITRYNSHIFWHYMLVYYWK